MRQQKYEKSFNLSLLVLKWNSIPCWRVAAISDLLYLQGIPRRSQKCEIIFMSLRDCQTMSPILAKALSKFNC